MSIGKNTLTRGLLTAGLTVLIVYGLSYIPAVHRLYGRVLHFREAYVPYIAPDSAFFGGYERMQQPYSKPFDSTMDIIVESHDMNIDAQTNRYHNITRGYLRVKRADGSYEDLPTEFNESYGYDTAWKHTSGDQRLPVAKTPATKSAPDSAHVDGSSLENKIKLRWRKLRKAKLPYHHKPNPDTDITILKRSVWIEKTDNVYYLYTKVEGTAIYKDKPSAAPDPVVLQMAEPIE